MHLEFKGGPVDACLIPGQRVKLASHWHTWVIDGEAQAKPPKPPKKNFFSFFIRSGLPKDPKVGQNLMLDLAVEGEPDECHGRVPVTLVVVDSVLITARTRNVDSFQIAPDTCPNVWVSPFDTLTIYR
jgi:hypothetical protein